MIYEGSCDTEYWSNCCWTFSFAITWINNILKYIKINYIKSYIIYETSFKNIKKILQTTDISMEVYVMHSCLSVKNHYLQIKRLSEQIFIPVKLQFQPFIMFKISR